MLHERLARGAGEGAAAALHTDRYARSLEGVDILYLGGFDYIGRHQAHRARRNAAPAADAVRLGFEHRVVGGESEDRVILLEHGQISADYGKTHHRAAGEYLAGLALEAAAEVDYLADIGAYGHAHVLRLGNRGAVHGEGAADEGLAGL